MDQKDLWIIWITRINLITIITHWKRLDVIEDLLILYIGEDLSTRSEIATHSMDGNIDVGMTLMLTLEEFSTGSDWLSSHLKERPRHSNVKILSFASVQLIWGAQTAM